MHLFILFSVILGCLSDLQVAIDKTGQYVIRVHGHDWFRSAETGLYTNDKWYSSDDKSLLLMNITMGQGTDRRLGSWNETQLHYDLNGNGVHTSVVASIRQWHEISAITFHLNTGNQTLTNTVPLDKDRVRTIFPSFKVEKLGASDNRSYFAFEGQRYVPFAFENLFLMNRSHDR